MKAYNVRCLFIVTCLVKSGYSQDDDPLRKWIYGKFNTADDADGNKSPRIEKDSNRGTYYNLNSQEMSSPVSLRKFNSLFIPYYRQKFNVLKNNMNYGNYKYQVTPHPRYTKIDFLTGNTASLRRKAEKYLLEHFVFAKPDPTTKTFEWESFRQESITDKQYTESNAIFSTTPSSSIYRPMGSATKNVDILKVNNNYNNVLKEAPNAFKDDITYFAEPSNVVSTLETSDDISKDMREEFTNVSEKIDIFKKILPSPELDILNIDPFYDNVEQLKSNVDKNALQIKHSYAVKSDITTEAENTNSEVYTNYEKSSESFYVPTEKSNEKTKIKYAFSDLPDDLVEYVSKSNDVKMDASFKNESNSVIDENAISQANVYTDLRNDVINEKSYENQDFLTNDVLPETIGRTVINKPFSNLIPKNITFSKINLSDRQPTSSNQTDELFPYISVQKIASNFDAIQSTETMFKNNSENNNFEDTTPSQVVLNPTESLTEIIIDEQKQSQNNEYEQGKYMQLTSKDVESLKEAKSTRNYVNNIYTTDFGSTINPTEINLGFFTSPYISSYSTASALDDVAGTTETLYLGKDLSNNTENLNSNENTKGNEKILSSPNTDITTSSAKGNTLFDKDNEIDTDTDNPANLDMHNALPKEITSDQQTIELFDTMRNVHTRDFVGKNNQVSLPYYDSVSSTAEDEEQSKLNEDNGVSTEVTENSKDNIDKEYQIENTYVWTTTNNVLKNNAHSFTESPESSQETTIQLTEALQNKNTSLENFQSEMQRKIILTPSIAEIEREKNERLDDNVEKGESIEETSNYSNLKSEIVNESLNIDDAAKIENELFALGRKHISIPIVNEINSIYNKEQLLRENNQFYETVTKQELIDGDNEEHSHEMSNYAKNSYDWTTSRSLSKNHNTEQFIEVSRNTQETTTDLNTDMQNEYTNLEYIQSATEMKSLLSSNITDKNIENEHFDYIPQNINGLMEVQESTDVNNENNAKFDKAGEKRTLYETTSYFTESINGETVNDSLSKENIEEPQSTRETITEFIAHQQNENTTLENVQSVTEMETLRIEEFAKKDTEEKHLDNGQDFDLGNIFDGGSSSKEFNSDLENEAYTVEVTTGMIGENKSLTSEINSTDLLRTLNMEILFETTTPPSPILHILLNKEFDKETDQFNEIGDGNNEGNVTSEERSRKTSSYNPEQSYDLTRNKSLLKHNLDAFTEDLQKVQETTTDFIDVQRNGHFQSAIDMKSFLPPYTTETVNKNNKTEHGNIGKGQFLAELADDKELNSDFEDEGYTTVEVTTRKINETKSSISEDNVTELLKTLNMINAFETTPSDSDNELFYDINYKHDLPNENYEDVVNRGEERSGNTIYETTTMSLSPNQLPSTVVDVFTNGNNEKFSTGSNIEYSTTVLNDIFFRTEKLDTFDQTKGNSNENINGYIHDTIESLKSITSSLLTNHSNDFSNENVTNINGSNQTVQNKTNGHIHTTQSDLENDGSAIEEVTVSENRMPKRIDLGKDNMYSYSNDAKENHEIKKGNQINFHRRSDITPEEDSEYSDM